MDVTGDHYFTAEPSTAVERRPVEFTLDGRDYRLVAASGVFSAARLDPGTAVLLHKAPLPDPATTATLLDLGCGYGPITAVLATAAPVATVYSVDVNSRALDLVRENTIGLGVADRVHAVVPDDVPADVTFAEIWSNPPVRVGKDDLHGMLLRWLPRLAPGGVAWIVIARHLGGDSLQRWLIEQGWSADRHASQKGYRVLRVSRGPGSR